MSTPFKAMKHYVQKNFDANNSIDPLMLDSSLDVDVDHQIGFKHLLLTDSLEGDGSLPSI